MNTREKEAYALLDMSRYNALHNADDLLELLIYSTTGNRDDYKKFRDRFTDIDTLIDNCDGDNATKNMLYYLASSYNRTIDRVSEIEMAMYTLSDGKAFDVDAEHIDAEMIASDITIDQPEEFAEFTDGLRDIK